MIIASILKRKGNQVVWVSPEDTVLAVAHPGGAPASAPRWCAARMARSSASSASATLRPAWPGVPVPPGCGRAVHDPDLLTAFHPDTLVIHALGLITRHRVRHLPVLDAGGGLIGLVSIGDLVKARIEEAEQETEELKHYVVSAG